jgi:hypothetical protein
MTTLWTEGAPDTASALESRRELAQRASDGFVVSLYWNETTNLVTVEVLDTGFSEGFEFAVEGRDALDAFNHPYAYAA